MDNGTLERVKTLIAERLLQGTVGVSFLRDVPQLAVGKMLRTRLANHLAGCSPKPPTADDLTRLCAAVEMVHTATLCHDDVIDGGLIRRSLPTLWRATSSSGAILIGDLLLCCALDLVLDAASDRHLRNFVAKVRETCSTEIEQELALRGQKLDTETCLRIARGKTGPLFAFVAQVCGGDDTGLSSALEEAGYRIGTAYQVADDLLDKVGDEDEAGKTLGTDEKNEKFTLANNVGRPSECVQGHVSELCRTALECLAPWPDAYDGLQLYIEEDLRPLFTGHLRRETAADKAEDSREMPS